MPFPLPPNGGAFMVDAAPPKEVSTPVETLLGAVNGALGGGFVALAASAGISYLQHEGASRAGKKILENMAGSHKWPIVFATAGFCALGGIVRFSRASKHNEWAARQQESASHAAAVEASREAPQEQAQGQGR